MAATPHRINRLRLDVQAENPERAFSIRRRLHDDWHLLIEQLEADFDALAGDDSWLRIPRLQFRLRVTDTRDLERRLPALLRETIDAQWPLPMRARGAARAAGVPGEESPQVYAGLRSATATFDHDRSHDTGVDRLTPEQVLEHYLVTGSLPWFASDIADWQSRFQALLEERFEALLTGVLERAAAAPALRLLNLVADAPLLRLLQGRFGQRPAADRMQPLLGVLLRAGTPVFASRHQRSWVVAYLLRQAQAGDAGPLAVAAPGEFGWRLPAAYRLPRSRWRRLLRQAGFEPLAPLPFSGVCAREPKDNGQTASGEPEAMQARSAAARSTDSAVGPAAGEALTTQPVSNAGLVLLHPYLARFFAACGIGLAGGRPAREVYDLAAAAMFFLAAGEAEPAEYELGLIKILLGLDPHYPLPLGTGLLDEALKSEANRLLDSFIAHWSALKSTTRDGLRQGFLRRAGLLRDDDRHWLLQVEAGGVDVLLERLPFSYSIVKLPWMQKPIQVEW